MDLERLGTLHPHRLSFMRSLIRRMMRKSWRIEPVRFDLSDEGFGIAVYEVETPQDIYSFVVFADHVQAADRSDRVIAEQWDVTAALRAGTADDKVIEELRKNVPLQEKGRVDAECIVLTRANRSVRNFEHVVGHLAAGEQPDLNLLAKVGYLCRTTAVYGSGKFGMADWEKICTQHREFARPFMAEMLACFLIREFSLDQAEHIAKRRAPDTAVGLDSELKRYMGIGNATGLGMAPYLINHPLLIARWIEVREMALAASINLGTFDEAHFEQLSQLIDQASQHLIEITTDNEDQNALNDRVRTELSTLRDTMRGQRDRFTCWRDVVQFVAQSMSVESQELVNSLLIELFPEHVDELEDQLGVTEDYQIIPDMPVKLLKQQIESHYQWALDYDFEADGARQIFWYRSEEKMEPRLGERDVDPGADREIMIGIAHSVQLCYENLCAYLAAYPSDNVAQFTAAHPECRRIVRRIQTMAKTHYGEIRANLLDRDVLPINLLRCKLSFFGVSKFDPRSRLWVRNTMFQGAPIREDIGGNIADDWYFPVMPKHQSADRA